MTAAVSGVEVLLDCAVLLLTVGLTGCGGLSERHRNAVVLTVSVVVSDSHVHAADVRWLVQHSGRRKPLT